MPILKKSIPILLSLTMLYGCGSAPSKSRIDPVVDFETFSPPTDAYLTVDIGDAIFVEGQVAKHRAYRMTGSIDSTMPGAYGIPFSFEINQTTLSPKFRRGEFEYYCAPLDQATASFPGLGTVVAAGDCIGIRRNIGTGEMEWTVDNSNANNMNTVWHRDVKESDNVKLTEATVTAYDQNLEFVEIVFDGFYSDLLHFTFEEQAGREVEKREFKFDYPPKSGEPVYGMKGHLFEVLEVTNSSMTYRWVN